MTYHCIQVEIHQKAALIRLNRPEVLNALNDQMMSELGEALKQLDAQEDIGAIVITGNEKAFAAGADIAAMSTMTYMDAYQGDFITRNWEQIQSTRKPVIAAVQGFALGGGCELAMMCDILICSDTAKFGQPEIKLGIIPGAGGTQRLVRAIGKAKAMDMCLTGRMMDAREAEQSGLVSRVVPAADCLNEALNVAQVIAAYSLPALMMLKESINQSQELGLRDGLRFERRLFHSLFATEDQKEGMKAFLEKRKPQFQNK